MKIAQRKWRADTGWASVNSASGEESSQLVVVFGAISTLGRPSLRDDIRKLYPSACIVGCSTAGEICGTAVLDDSLIVTSINFESSQVHGASANLEEFEGDFQAGEFLAKKLPLSVPALKSGAPDNLAHVLVLSDGVKVNGSDLVRGLMSHLPPTVTVTGGLAGDGARFQETLVVWENVPRKNMIVAIGLYGDRLKIGFGSLGGWDSFGPERLITRAKGNVLYELDNQSALGLYKKYLGEHAERLPAAGLLFPLSLRTKTSDTAVVRTILSIDEKEQNMTFAGDVPEGAYARLMKANFDRLIDGAAGAARTSYQAIGANSPDLAILISCVGRKLVLKQRIEEEVEGVRDVLGARTVLTGFYSYGEISPFAPGARCELHNQTMTITTISEQ